MNASPPLVSVVLPVRDGERFVARAVASVLRQSLRELELIVVEDASADATGAILSEIADERLVVVRNERPLGLAASLNLGLERARGRYVARMDADDISLPRRLERQLVRLRCAPAVGIVGSGVTEIDEQDRLGATHLLPSGGVVTRWRSLFGTPFLHPTVLFERALVERLGLRYDESYEAGEPEDYELWVRLLAHCEGDNMPAALLLYRRHAKQASELRRVDQLERRRQIATEQIRAVAPALTPAQAELARLVGDAGRPGAKDAAAAGDAFLSLLEAFEGQARPHSAERQALRGLAAGSLARLAASAEGAGRVRLVRRALALDPALAPREIGLRSRRRRVASSVAREAPAWLASLARGEPGQRAESRPLRVAVVSPEPTPYRSPLFDRVAERPEIDLTVFYAAETLIDRAWQIELRHRHRVLAGFRVPGLRRLLRHDYRVTPGIAAALGASRPDVVVVTGWSTFSSQAAVVWCRLHRVPFLLLASSHDEGPRPGWRRRVKGAVVPRIVRRAEGALVLGTLSRRSLIARGAAPESVRVFANTIDVRDWGERADRLGPERPALRASLGTSAEDVVVLSVARLAPEKGLETLVRAVAADPRLLLVLAGSGPESGRLERLAERVGARLRLAGEVPWERLVELYVAADVFALLSEHEPWGVVVNEAAACGLPLVLSDRVGAAPDLLRDGENGRLVPCGDVQSAAAALLALADDPEGRSRAGQRSRELVAEWDYETSVENFVRSVQEAVSPRARRIPSNSQDG